MVVFALQFVVIVVSLLLGLVTKLYVNVQSIYLQSTFAQNYTRLGRNEKRRVNYGMLTAPTEFRKGEGCGCSEEVWFSFPG